MDLVVDQTLILRGSCNSIVLYFLHAISASSVEVIQFEEVEVAAFNPSITVRQTSARGVGWSLIRNSKMTLVRT